MVVQRVAVCFCLAALLSTALTVHQRAAAAGAATASSMASAARHGSGTAAGGVSGDHSSRSGGGGNIISDKLQSSGAGAGTSIALPRRVLHQIGTGRAPGVGSAIFGGILQDASDDRTRPTNSSAPPMGSLIIGISEVGIGLVRNKAAGCKSWPCSYDARAQRRYQLCLAA